MLSGVEYNRRESVDQIESAESEDGPRDYASSATADSRTTRTRLFVTFLS